MLRLVVVVQVSTICYNGCRAGVYAWREVSAYRLSRGPNINTSVCKTPRQFHSSGFSQSLDRVLVLAKAGGRSTTRVESKGITRISPSLR